MRRYWLGLVTGLAAVGCGGGGPAVVPVSGTVTLDGQPLAGASVSFQPTEDVLFGFGGTARTGADGKYQVTNPKGGQGVPAGPYLVTVSKAELKNPALAEFGGVTDADVKESVPAPYTKADTTPLRFTVEPGKAIDIALDSKKKK